MATACAVVAVCNCVASYAQLSVSICSTVLSFHADQMPLQRLSSTTVNSTTPCVGHNIKMYIGCH